jgi:hypothetical protein
MFRVRHFSFKAFRVMKITMALMFFLSMQVSAVAYAQKISLFETQASLKEIFKELRKQTGYDFLLNTEMLADAKPVTIYIRDASIEEVLNKCFEGQPLTYTINNKTIVVKRKAPLQRAEITGKVTDENGTGIPGARILNQTTNKSAITDETGAFKIDAIAGDKLQVIMMGYDPQIITVDSKQNYTVTLKAGRKQRRLQRPPCYFRRLCPAGANARCYSGELNRYTWWRWRNYPHPRYRYIE